MRKQAKELVSRCSGKEIGKPGEGYIVAVSVAFWFKCSSSVAMLFDCVFTAGVVVSVSVSVRVSVSASVSVSTSVSVSISVGVSVSVSVSVVVLAVVVVAASIF